MSESEIKVTLNADAVAAEAARVGGELALNAFGPASKELGVIWAEKLRSGHARRVAERAQRKSALLPERPGTMNHRVGMAVLDAAQAAENEFLAEYLSGVLASSKSDGGQDDSGVVWSALIDRLSSEQLRAHYVIYAMFRRLALGADDIWTAIRRPFVTTYPALAEIYPDGYSVSILEALYGLQSEGLLGESLSHGDPDILTGFFRGKDVSVFEDSGVMIVQATPRGIWLFLRAHGYSGQWISRMIAEDADLLMTSDEPVFTAEPWGIFLDDVPARQEEHPPSPE